MSAKTSTVQPPGRRTPLSLNTSTKQVHKPTNNKNDNNKKEANSYNNQKTDNSKKDSQPEKKNFVEKKNLSADARKQTSESSKKADEVKANEESKKSQNGVSTNGVKDKGNTTEAAKSGTPKKETQKPSNDGAKSKAETGAASKKESQKAAAAVEKKEDTAPPLVVKETKKDDTKNKEKTSEESVQKSEDKKHEKDTTEKSEDTISDAKKTEITKTADKPEKDMIETNDVSSADSKKGSETKVDVEPEKVVPAETKIEESPKISKNPESELSEDVEMMEPLTFDDELPPHVIAASTPAKPIFSDDFTRRPEPKSEAQPPLASVHTPDRKNYPRAFSSISGRRSIRPIGDYSFSGNLQIRESYRKINTELDFTSSSLNVTVGSEVPNNDSFSFFSRSRKRDRSSPSRQSAMEVQGDISPKSPKRARIDMGMAGFFSVMASPITMLRSRLARTSVQSTPKKQPETPIEDDVVENVSGISVNAEITTTEDLTMNPDSTVDNAAIENDQPKCDEPIISSEKPAAEDAAKQEDDLKPQDIVVTVVEPQAKKKCSIM